MDNKIQVVKSFFIKEYNMKIDITKHLNMQRVNLSNPNKDFDK